MDIMTPSYLFSAISLLLMGYNTRYLALTKLIREKCNTKCSGQDERLNLIIFRKRLEYIKKLQMYSLYSLIFSVLSTLLILLDISFQRSIFIMSLLLFLVSLYYSIKENFLSTKHI